jgi:hypothetical protein
MSSDMSVQAVAGIRTGREVAADSKMVSPSEPPPAEAAFAQSPVINPTLRLDAALGLVVIEFRNDSGAVTTSIPSERQLEAYQRWEQTQAGPAPAHHAMAPGEIGEPAVTTENVQVPETSKP